MTQETCIVIDLKDVGVVKFQCGCGASKSFQPDGNIDVPPQCHQCGGTLVSASNVAAYHAVKSFMESLKQIRLLADAERCIRLTVPIK